MGTLLRIGWTNLRRDRVAQALTFVLPIVFFSIFAMVFGSQRNAATARIRIAIVDEDQSEVSARLIEGLRAEPSLRARMTADESDAGPRLDRAAAERLVRSGDVPVAVVIPHGMGEAFSTNGFAGGGPPVQLLSDVSDPIAPQMVLGLLQKVAMTAAPDLLMQGGMRQFEARAGALTPEQQAAVNAWLPRL
jgi:ABC-2 type transport system permease protein